MLMRYLNTLTGSEIEVKSEIFAPHYVKVGEDVKVEDKPAKKPTTAKKGTKKK